MSSEPPLVGWLGEHAGLVVFLGVIIDALGVPFPGRLLLVVVGAWVAAHDASPLPFVLIGAAAALVGDHVWYLTGRLGRGRLLGAYCRLSLASRGCVARTRRFYRRWGPLMVVLGRFVAGVRILASPLAGSGEMRYGTFLAYDIAGALVWSAMFVLVGWVAGDRATAAIERVGTDGVVVTAAALGVAGLAVIVFRLWRRSRFGAASLESRRLARWAGQALQ